MPFTLAHPAAILPLRGMRYLRTAPLIVGALVPDTYDYVPANLRGHLHHAHSFEGSYTSCILLGYALLAALFVLRRPLTALLSARARWLCLNALAPFGRSRLEWVLAVLAIVLGAWTHLLWDSFTHSEGWMVHHFAALNATVTIGSYRGPVYHVLQYVSSAIGLAVVAAWYWRLPAPPASPAIPGAQRSAVGPVLMLVVAAALLIGGVKGTEKFTQHHYEYLAIHVFLTYALAWFALLYLVAGIIVSLEDTHERVAGLSA
ncbi:MAG TPA: DUF4184 family protein [Steroidobacteraceae bacterium]|nr:DUF4184 family protein [Steroidobacteraceae bacterium]